jgi:hypothetical protein
MDRNGIRVTLTALMAASLFLLFSGGKMREGKVKGVEEAALISVFCDKRIDTSDFKGIASASSQLAQNDDFNLKPIAEKLRDDIFNRYAQGFPFTLKDESTVIHSPAYEKLATKKFDINKVHFASPDGYVVVPYLNKKAFKTLLETYPDAEAFLFCAADFRLEKTSSLLGFGTAKVKSNVEIAAIDRKQKLIMRKTSYASSEDTIKFSLRGVFDASQIQPLCTQATEKAAKKFEGWFANKMEE